MQKITPFLWFDNNAEEAIKFYTSLFPNSKIESINYYPDNSNDPHMKGMGGKVLTAVLTLAGHRFMALDGGPTFQKTPATSFFFRCQTVAEADTLFEKLSDGGTVHMEYQEYPFAKKYGWVSDKYGVSWQVMFSGTNETQRIVPSLMFVGDNAGKATEAISFYTSLFPNSHVGDAMPYPKEANEKEGSVAYASFILSGQEFAAMDSSLEHKFTFTEGVSLYVQCEDQTEVDTLWNKLTTDGGAESECGWLKDKYGLSWQIIPKQLGELMSDPDQEKAGRVMHAMLQMKKIEVTKLQEAYEGK
jgi:predicted 3-demethylubiquinone-9 3-methyltransferase (glyoxalase superfamily)